MRCEVLLVCVGVLLGGAAQEVGYCIGNQCYGVYADRKDFRGAQDRCRQRGGLLMTVRSTVENEIVVLLLGNTTGAYWIGLHLPKGCPDPSTHLRGFEWVTTDTTSDFYNWASPVDPSCSPPVPRCVSVSKNSNFLWTQAHCEKPASGFLCEFPFQEPCPGLQPPPNSQTFYTTPYGFTVEGAVSLPPGSVAELLDERKQVCVSGQWLAAPWSCEIQRGGCEHKCTTDPENDPVCYCPPGFTVNPVNGVTCEDAVDDPCFQLKCQHACYKYSDSFLCACDEGFYLAGDKRTCVDFDECTDERQCPGETEKCFNTEGGFQCVCKDGFLLKGGVCVDVNECVSAPCEHMCDNTLGSYVCSCYEGYKVDPKSLDKCKLHCDKEECDAECDPNNKFQCNCPDGYVMEERVKHSVCIDIDECEAFYCDQHCENSFGGYECFCNPGYELVDGYKCQSHDIDDTGDTTKVMEATVAPTRQPSAVSVWGLVGIIVCTVFFILLAVFLIYHILCGREKADSTGALKAPEGPEVHSLQQVTTDTAS